MNGIVMNKFYKSLGVCADKKYMIVINDHSELFPYRVDGFDINCELNKLEKFKAMIESKTYLIG